MSEPKFKAGDRIRLIKDGSYGYKKGDTGTVVQEYSTNPWCSMDRESGNGKNLYHMDSNWPTGKSGMWTDQDHMELISGGIMLNTSKKPLIILNCNN